MSICAMLVAKLRRTCVSKPLSLPGTTATWFCSSRAAAKLTEQAIRRGDQVVYQATFFDGRWLGLADFLLRVERPSDLGGWSYEVVDTKLARHVRSLHRRTVSRTCGAP